MVVPICKLMERGLVGGLTACWSRQTCIRKEVDFQADGESSVIIFGSSSWSLLNKDKMLYSRYVISNKH